jgi:hypothetical protein
LAWSPRTTPRRGSGSQGRADAVAGLQSHRPFNDVFQLADIAGVRQPLQHSQGLWLKTLELPAHFAAKVGQEVLGQRQDVFTPLAQGRQAHFNDVEAEVQVRPEPAFLDHVAQGAVGRRHHPHIDRDFFAFTNRRDDPLLQHTQEFDLQVQGQVADFIQEDRTARLRLQTGPSCRGWHR